MSKHSTRVAVMGAGGLGSKFGGLLALAGVADVTLIHHRPEHVQAICQNGLTIARGSEEQIAYLHATTDPAQVGLVDLVLMMVKSYDTEAACDAMAPLLDPETLVVTFQNGLGNLECIARRVGTERAVLGVTFQGATLEGPGRVADKGRGPTYLASRPETLARLERIAAAFNHAGIETQLRGVDEVDGLLWGKLAMVSGVNPVAATLRVTNGILGEVEAARELSLAAIEETTAVAQAKGIRLPFDPKERFNATTCATYHMFSGTLLDAMRGRRTEIDSISGAIAAEGERLGVAVPTNRTLWRIVRALEATHPYRAKE